MSPAIFTIGIVLVGVALYFLTTSLLKHHPKLRKRVSVIALLFLSLCFTVMASRPGSDSSTTLFALIFVCLAIALLRRNRVPSRS